SPPWSLRPSARRRPSARSSCRKRTRPASSSRAEPSRTPHPGVATAFRAQSLVIPAESASMGGDMATAPALAVAPKRQAEAPKTVTAVEMGARQREISVSEFFTKNRHLLGFDNPRKALLTCVKEAVDNALDAREEAGILPDVAVKAEVAGTGEPPALSQASRFRITITDNGPGIVRRH